LNSLIAGYTRPTTPIFRLAPIASRNLITLRNTTSYCSGSSDSLPD